VFTVFALGAGGKREGGFLGNRLTPCSVGKGRGKKKVREYQGRRNRRKTGLGRRCIPQTVTQKGGKKTGRNKRHATWGDGGEKRKATERKIFSLT